MSTGCRLLMIVGVTSLIGLGIVASLVIPEAPISRVMTKAQLVKSQAAMKDLQLGIKNYAVEYDRMPSALSECDSSGALLKVLLGENVEGLNIRQIVFLEPAMAWQGRSGLLESDGGYTLVDVWGHPYKIAMAKSGGIRSPETPGAMIDKTVIVWSAGPDGDFSTWSDNVKSW